MWCKLGHNPYQNLIRICQAVAIGKVLKVEFTVGMTIERRKFNILR